MSEIMSQWYHKAYLIKDGSFQIQWRNLSLQHYFIIYFRLNYVNREIFIF